MKISRAKKLLSTFSRKRIVIIGDLMLDRYVTGTVARISPEAPVPVVKVDSERAIPGGAANVALNIQSLGGKASIVGVAGCDKAGAELTGLLAGVGVDTRGIMASEAVQTCVKTRVMADRQQIVRVDREDSVHAVQSALRRFVARLEDSISEDADAVIIDDYGKGVVSQGVVNEVMKICRRRKVPVGFDPKYNRSMRVKGLTLATPNMKEAFYNAGVDEEHLTGDLLKNRTLERVGRILSRKWGVEMLMVTLGAQGMYLRPARGRAVLMPAAAREVFDVSGAGDTVIASTMLSIASGASFREASEIANAAAGVVVAKVGTAVCSPDELLKGILK